LYNMIPQYTMEETTHSVSHSTVYMLIPTRYRVWCIHPGRSYVVS
jgi:hypothetical protein